MAFTNTGFEDAGTNPGDALGWPLGSSVSAELFAEFGTGSPKKDAEDFEAEWDSNEDYLFAFDPLVDIVAPLFDATIGLGETFEDFEEGWSLNQGYSFEMGSSEAASFDTALTPEDFDDFEEGWDSNEDYDFTMGSTSAAMFDSGGQAFEDFEEGWFSGSYETSMGATSAATFDGAEAFEDFEETYGPIVPSTIDYGTSTFTYVGHGLANTNVVRVSPLEGGLLPSPLQEDTNYYVVGVSGSNFQLSATSGGSAISLFPLGFGISIVRNPATHWPVDGPT